MDLTGQKYNNMKDNILEINLETETAPVVQEVRGREYVEYGTENWKNTYPQFLIDLYYNSSTHAAIINATAEMIAGEDLILDDEYDDNLDMYVKLKKFLKHANGKESLHQIIKKVAFDFKLQGAYAIHVIFNQSRTEIVEIYHVPVERVRAGRPNEMGKVDTYYISADWGNTRTHRPYPIPAFNANDRTSASQLLYTGAYSPNMDIYHTPDYLAGCNWALVDQMVAEYHLGNIQRGFSGSYFISFANGIPTQEERMQIEDSLAQKFGGSANSGKMVLTFSDDRNRVPEITPIAVSNADKQYLALQELLVQNILTAHRVTSPMLMGIKSDTGLGNNADELNSASNFYLNTVVRGFQLHIMNTLQTIFSVNNMDLPVEFVQLKPITTRFTNQDLMAVMTQDEIREELGLAPLNDEVVVKEDMAKVGSMVTDGVELPLFDTKEEAEEEAEKMGCKGHHEHKQDGKTYYMPCESHDQITSLNKCDCSEEKIERFSNKTELESFLETLEDIPEDWDLVHEEVVDGEHQDFDFEAELNKVAKEKINLASTGRANPNARSEQDGLNKSGTFFYKVRYVYTTDNFLVNKSGTSRDFCRLMINAKKIYRKEDIVNMGTKAVNAGFGPRGASTYSIWFYKGGPECRHFWLRQVYRAPAADDDAVYYKDNIDDDTMIGYTKAISEGFTAQRNDKLVATPPQRMVNRGYLD